MSAAVLAGCEPAGQDVKLPSGRQIRILGVGKMYFSNDATALMLKYQTAIPLDDARALEDEVNEIWERFRFDVEKAQLTVGIVSAQERSRGFIITFNRVRNFAFRKCPANGQWFRITGSECAQP
jgi:hypothetical protein